jgi:uncharacterized protein YkwD
VSSRKPHIEEVISMNEPSIFRAVDVTNIERYKAGLSPLQFNPVLGAVAQNHSVDMALNDFFARTGSTLR